MKKIEKQQFCSGKKLLLICLTILLALIIAAAFDCRLLVRSYTIEAEEISSPVRIALVTDLHSCRYGEGQAELIGAVEDLNPDLVLLGGDIFDDVLPDVNTELFIAGIAGKYPCYYVTGNHEHWSGEAAFAAKMDILRKHGVAILSGACETLSINGNQLNICGADDPDVYKVDKQGAFPAQLGQLRQLSENGNYTILLSHRPEYFNAYAECGFDLALCGHAHGGQWRLPLLLNGLYAPDQGLFPAYAGGKYEQGDTTMIVSRGLARESTRLPRIFNRPELVLAELK